MLKLRANSIVKGKIEGVAIQNRKIFDRTAARKRADARKRVRIIQNQKGISKKPQKILQNNWEICLQNLFVSQKLSLVEKEMNRSIIETYHGLTTSKPLQLRCFQSG